MDAWERQIAEDSFSGKFDDLIQEVLAEHKAGQTTQLGKGLGTRVKR